MGMLSRAIKSRRFPFSQLSNFALKMEQLKVAQMLFGLSEKEMTGKERPDWTKLTKLETMIPRLSTYSFSMLPSLMPFQVQLLSFVPLLSQHSTLMTKRKRRLLVTSKESSL